VVGPVASTTSSGARLRTLCFRDASRQPIWHACSGLVRQRSLGWWLPDCASINRRTVSSRKSTMARPRSRSRATDRSRTARIDCGGGCAGSIRVRTPPGRASTTRASRGPRMMTSSALRRLRSPRGRITTRYDCRAVHFFSFNVFQIVEVGHLCLLVMSGEQEIRRALSTDGCRRGDGCGDCQARAEAALGSRKCKTFPDGSSTPKSRHDLPLPELTRWANCCHLSFAIDRLAAGPELSALQKVGNERAWRQL
jgi:hypothetical protein